MDSQRKRSTVNTYRHLHSQVRLPQAVTIELILALAAYPLAGILVAAILDITDPDSFRIADDDSDPFIAFVVIFWPAFLAMVLIRLIVRMLSISPSVLARLISKAARITSDTVREWIGVRRCR